MVLPLSFLFSGMHVLWLCSWYPNTVDRFDGDFIARHAAALATIHKVHVIHVVQNHELLQQAMPISYIEKNHQLTEQIHILPYARTNLALVNRLLFNLLFYRTYRNLLARYIKQHGKPDLVHVHVPVKAAMTARWLQQMYGVPFVITEHSSAYDTGIPHAYQQRNWFFRYQTSTAFKNAAAVSSVSCWLLQRLQQLFALQHIQLIRNCVDTNLFFPVVRNNAAGCFRFIHVSMLVPLKNVNGILLAFQQLHQLRSDWELVVVGPADAAIKHQAAQMGLENQVRWEGLLNYPAVAKALQQADVLVHFSNYENLPCVINEALCCGVPVISSNVGGIAEIVNASNGILVPPKDITALHNALVQMLNTHHQYQQASIAAAAANAFSYQTIGMEMMEWYRSVLQRINP